MFKKILLGICIVTLFAVVLNLYITNPKIAYVNTSKIMIGFTDASKVEKELKAEDVKLQSELKILQDTLAKQIDLMSKEYNTATPQRKKELQDQLSAANQQINNFKIAANNKLEKMKQEKLKGIIEKINLYLDEYGKKHHYSIIFGTTTGGNIVYGDINRYDISEAIIKGLNERYK